MTYILDIGPLSGSVGAGLIFFLVFVAIAYVAFRLLTRTVKMAFRMAVVGVILAVAVIGGAALLWFGSGSAEKPRSAPSRSR